MNIIFTVIFILSTFGLLLFSPQAFLETMLDGASKSASTCIALLSSYAVWLGLMRVWEDSGLARGFSKFLRPVSKKLFQTDDEAALDAICMNLSVNLLGISGAATPYGIQAANLLDKSKNAEYSSAMLFVLNATSLQLFPASMIAVRVSMQSVAPNAILLPTLFTTIFSTLLGAVLVKLCIRPENQNFPTKKHTPFFKKLYKTKGACTR